MKFAARFFVVAFASIALAHLPARCQTPVERPALFFRVDWKFPPAKPGAAAMAPTLENMQTSNPNLELKVHGTAKLLPTEPLIETVASSDFPRLWTGNCATGCGVTFRDKDNYVDLTGRAMVRWVTRVSGFHQVRPLVKLANGTWLVGDHADAFMRGQYDEFHESEFSISEVRWIEMDMDRMVTASGCGTLGAGECKQPKPGTGSWVDKPDLSKVDEIGFVDLLPGSGHGPGGFSNVGWIEVYGKPVKR